MALTSKRALSSPNGCASRLWIDQNVGYVLHVTHFMRRAELLAWL